MAGGGTTDDLAALEELPWNSVSIFFDADDTVRLTIFGNTARGLRTCFSFKPLHVSPEAWPRTFTLAGVSLEGLSWAFRAPGVEVLARHIRGVQATFIFSSFRTVDT